MPQTEKVPEGSGAGSELRQRLNSPPSQFGIAALFWLTLMVGLALAYLQEQGGLEVVAGGLLSLVIGLTVGLAFGLPTGKTADSVFWAMLVAAFGYIATTGDQLSNSVYCLIWASLGAVTGAVGATVFTNKVFLNALACGAAAGMVILVSSPMLQRNTVDITFDLYAAPMIGVAIALFMRIVIWLETKRRMPRYITATWLLVGVIAGSWLS